MKNLFLMLALVAFIGVSMTPVKALASKFNICVVDNDKDKDKKDKDAKGCNHDKAKCNHGADGKKCSHEGGDKKCGGEKEGKKCCANGEKKDKTPDKK